MSASYPCRDELLLQRYLDGQMRPAEQLDFARRLRQERDLSQALVELEETRDFIRADDEEPAPLGIGFADQLWARFEKEALVDRTPLDRTPLDRTTASSQDSAAVIPIGASDDFVRQLRFWTALAASILLLLTAFALFYRPHETGTRLFADQEPGIRTRVLRDIDKRADEMKHVELENEAARKARK